MARVVLELSETSFPIGSLCVAALFVLALGLLSGLFSLFCWPIVRDLTGTAAWPFGANVAVGSTTFGYGCMCRYSLIYVSVDAVNSVHGRHFVLVGHGRLRASDEITLQGDGGGVVVHSLTPSPCPVRLSLALSLPSATSTKWLPWTFTASAETASYAGYYSLCITV